MRSRRGLGLFDEDSCRSRPAAPARKCPQVATRKGAAGFRTLRPLGHTGRPFLILSAISTLLGLFIATRGSRYFWGRGDGSFLFVAHYFRVKAELYGMMLDKSSTGVDGAWYDGLVRSYNLLAASEGRHYYSGLKAVGTSPEAAPVKEEIPALEDEIARRLQQYGLKAA